ncbi:MAG: hypothetical protein HZC41_26845 [Chloroflexi bacterium]|nr:hypothetical protein [Chloroflexota bacterium]
MDEYHAAILTVPADWTVDTPIGLSQQTVDEIFDDLHEGMRVLIFKGAPVNAIVAEGEIVDQVLVKLDEWPSVNVRQRPMNAWGKPTDYVVPLRILYTRAEHNQVPLTTILDWADSPINAEWIPLDRDSYERFTNWP